MSLNWKTVRAVKAHRCDEMRSGCKGIKPGQVYVREVYFPGDEVEEITVVKICAHCMDSIQSHF